MPCWVTDRGLTQAPRAVGYGPLIEDSNGLLDLPEGFNYRVLSQLGDLMNDGTPVPDKADGMGCFQGENGELILVRNHELRPDDDDGSQIAEGFDTAIAACCQEVPHILLDSQSLAVKRQFRSRAEPSEIVPVAPRHETLGSPAKKRR